MADAIMVCGLGQVGYRVTSLLLDLGESVVVVTDQVRPEWARLLSDRGVAFYPGDARDEHVLLTAGLKDATALIACTASDLTNIEIALDAKRHRSDLPVVARMFDQSLADQLEQNLEMRRVIAMSQVAAPAFAAAAFGDHVVAEFELGPQRLVVFSLVLEEDDLQEWTVAEIERRHGVEVLLFGDELDPPGDRRLKPGDRVELLGSSDTLRLMRPEQRPMPTEKAKRKTLNSLSRIWKQTTKELRIALSVIAVLTLLSVVVFSYGMNLSPADAVYFVITTVTTTGYGDITPRDSSLWVKLYACFMMVMGSATVAVLYSIVTDFIVSVRLQQLVGGHQVPERGHVVVTGVGDVGLRIINELDRLGAHVVAVDADAGASHLASVRSRFPVIVGDARDVDTLRRAGVDRAAALVAASGDDAVNLSVGLAAETIEPQVRTVLRLFDSAFASKVQSSLGIDVALSASRTAAPAFVSAALHEGSLAAFVLNDILFSIVEGGGDWSLRIDELGRISSSGVTEICVIVRPLVSDPAKPI